MRRHFNMKAAGQILGIVFLLGSGLVLLHGYQVVGHAAALLQRADAAIKKDRVDQALRYYNLYLSYRPNDMDAMASYGLLLEKQARKPAERERAAVVLDGVLRRDPHRKEVRHRLIHCLVSLQRLREAVAHAEKLLPEWDVKDGELEHILGWCNEDMSKYEKAAEWFRLAIRANPRRTESYVLLAEVLQQKLNERDKAVDVMDDLVKANGTNYRAYLLRRWFLLHRPFINKDQKESDDAQIDEDLQRALKLDPEQPEVVLAAAESARARDRLEEARALIGKGLEKYPQHEALYLALADIERGTPAKTGLRAALERGVKNVPQSWDLLVQLIDLLIDDKDLPAAEKRTAALRRLGPSSPLPDYFQARLRIERRQWTEAIAMLERLRVELSLGSVWLMRMQAQLGWCYFNIGDAEQQLVAFDRAFKLDPNVPFVRWGKGSALLALGRLDEALHDLHAVTVEAKKDRGVPAPPSAWSDMARCQMLRNLRLPEDKRNWQEVKFSFDQAAKTQPRTVETVILHADLAAAQKKFDDARTLLEAARHEFPKSTLLECALADLALRQQDVAAALAVLDKAEKKFGPALDIRQARLRLWSRQPGKQARREVTALGENLQAIPPGQRARLLRDLAEAWTRLSDPRKAEHFWRRLIEEQPNDPRARLSLLELSLQAGKVDAARQIVADLRKLEGEKGACWHYGAAALLVIESAEAPAKLDQARKHLAECGKTRTDWGQLPLLEAQIDELEGKFGQAIDHYSKAFDLGERSPRLVFRLVKLLQERRELTRALGVFHAFEEQGPLQPDMARLGAELALSNNDIAQAVTLAKQAMPAESRDYRDYLWLARIYQINARGKAAAGQTSEAEAMNKEADKLLNHVVELAPHTPDTWLAIVMHLVQTDRAKLVPQVMAEVMKKVPSHRLPLTLARCHEALGQFGQAEKFYREALAQHPDDFVLLSAVADFFRHSDQPDKAVPLLEKLFDPASRAPEGFQNQARRSLALILAATNQKRAQEVLAVYPRGAFPAVDRTRALVLGFEAAHRGDAMKTFEELRKNEPASPDELWYYARICAAADKIDRARELLGELATSYPDNAQFLAGYVHSLLQNGDAKGAWTYWQKLDRREPDSTRTLDLKKLVIKAQGN